jgi:tripartite-type tricarboxylate transporter receptor subunit TctC
MKAPLALPAWLLVAAGFAGPVLAQGYPSKPITFVIPFAAGGDSDLSGRNVAQHAQKYLNNQPIISVNRVGASGTIGAAAVRAAPADGYTLLVARIATHAIMPALESKLSYKWNDFTMLSLIELNPFICFVKADAPWKNAAELIASTRAYPGKLNFSTSVLGGQVHFACNNAPTVIPQIKAGALRGMFVMPARLPEIPEVPTAREAGYPDMEKIVGWTALMGPPGLPKEVVDRWVEVFARLAKDPDWQAGNARLGGIAAIRSPAETEKFVREQYELYAKLVSALGIRQ